jgi:hypothetical protein
MEKTDNTKATLEYHTRMMLGWDKVCRLSSVAFSCSNEKSNRQSLGCLRYP